MSWFPRIRVTKRARRSLAGFLTVIIALVFILQAVGLRPIHAIQRGFSVTGTKVGKVFNNIRGYEEISNENLKLRKQVLSLGKETIDVMTLREENRELRALLQFRDEEAPNIPVVLADVLTRSIGSQRAQVTLNVGRRDGVREGAAVIVEDGVIIGLVFSVTENASIVHLISDHRSRVAAKIGLSETIGVAEGTRGSLLDFRFIPQTARLEVNDLVQTSGVEEGVPASLVIGLVTEVIKDDTEPFKAATIEPLVDLRSYQTVAVVVPAT